MTPIDQVHARVGNRVLVSGPSVLPYTLKWVTLRTVHTGWVGYGTALKGTSEPETYLKLILQLEPGRI